MSDKPLIVYVTRSGNTKALGEMIQDEVGGDMVELEPLEPYSPHLHAPPGTGGTAKPAQSLPTRHARGRGRL